jgi:hypothetical protein
MKTKKVLMSMVSGFVIGTLLGVLLTSVKPHEGKKGIARISAEYSEEASPEQAGIYAIL